jgi:hypothetical protein
MGMDIFRNEWERAQRRRAPAKRRFWVRPWVLRREELGSYSTLMEELRLEDVSGFINFMRVEPQMFQELLARVGERITKKDTSFHKALEPGLKLAVTLRHLATGDSYHSLMYSFRIPHNSISKIVREVTQALVDEYKGEAVVTPKNPEEWKAVADQYASRWNFHHSVGALDGKHVRIRCPPRGGSLYFNYKKFHSIVLFALAGPNYEVLWCDIGEPGSAGDAGIFNDSDLKRGIESGKIRLPPPEPLPGDDKDVPYFIIGDDAFGLKTWMMKPFGSQMLPHDERIFNYRLSRARRVVENTFGILSSRWRCLLTTLLQNPETVRTIVMACVTLHNIMRARYPNLQNAMINSDEEVQNLRAWRDECDLTDIQAIPRGNTMSNNAKRQRLYLKHYYNSIGAVEWQENMI